MARIKKGSGAVAANMAADVKEFILLHRSDVPVQYKGTFDTPARVESGVLVGGASKVKSALKALLTADEYKTAIE